VERAQLVVVQIAAGPIETNAFLVVEPQSGEAFIIDAPPDALDPVQGEVERLGARPVALVLTHTHWDHVGDAAALKEAFGIPIWMHELGRTGLEQPSSAWLEIRPAQAERFLNDGDVVALGNRSATVFHTPGHSKGQISLYFPDDALFFGGDTLFPNGYGRVDIPGASAEETIATMARLLSLPDDVTVLPGHGASTTIGRERPWMEQVARTGRLLE
jgi:hydroxyacylglutathione hydrolase